MLEYQISESVKRYFYFADLLNRLWRDIREQQVPRFHVCLCAVWGIRHILQDEQFVRHVPVTY